MDGQILFHKALGGLVLGIRSEGGQHHQALDQAGIGDLGLDAVQAVHAEVEDVVQLALGLGQEGRGLGGIDGQEHHVAAGVADGVDLGGEVGGGAGGEGLLLDNLQAAGGGFGLEGLIEAGGIVDIGLIEHGDLGAQVVVGDIVGGSGTLRGVIEANAEGVGVALDAGYG